MRHIRNYCEYDEAGVFFGGRLLCKGNFLSNTKYDPARNPCSTMVQGQYLIFQPHPYLAIAPFGPSRPSPSAREKGLFKEQRKQRPNEELTLSLFWEIRYPKTAFILTRDCFKAPKSSLTKSFPSTQPFLFYHMSCSWLYSHLL